MRNSGLSKKARFGMLGLAFVGFSVLGMEASAADLPDCNVDDFTAAGVSSDDCSNGPAGDNNASVEEISSLGWGDGWTFGGKYEKDGGLESGSLIDLLVSVEVDEVGKVFFNWAFPEAQLTFNDAAFVVKQASGDANNPGGWVAYYFDPLNASYGDFQTKGSFSVDDYSSLSIYTRGNVTTVPEINAGGTGLALALLLGMMAVYRERRV